jgi:hypothetical protein
MYDSWARFMMDGDAVNECFRYGQDLVKKSGVADNSATPDNYGTQLI